MKIVQLTPGAGGMYCGGCFRDNALVAALRRQGHDTLMLPLYLPLTLDERDQSAGTPIFFSGVNVYLEQKIPWFRHAPAWLHHLMASPRLLKLVGTRAAKTRAADVADLTISMLRGADGNQARELDELVAWLREHHRPDWIVLSNALLMGLAPRLGRELGVPIACLLSGEDAFLDGIPEPQRSTAWRVAAEQARSVSVFIAPSRYFADLMARRLGIAKERIHVVHNGLNLDGFPKEPPVRPEGAPPVLGYFARMCPEKGLDVAVEVFLELKRRGRIPDLQLHVGGGCGPGDEPFVRQQRARLEQAGVLQDVRFSPNVTREDKVAFLQGLDVFCVPAVFGEAFGLYLLEALAVGVPVVQPRTAAFPEIVEATGGGLIAGATPQVLAEALESLLLDRARAKALGRAGQLRVQERFTIEQMARDVVAVLSAGKESSTSGPSA